MSRMASNHSRPLIMEATVSRHKWWRVHSPSVMSLSLVTAGYGQSGGYGQAGGYDYSAYRNYSSQQPASGSEQSRSDNSYYGYNQGQQQLGNYADSTAYAGTRNYSSGTENYGQQATYQQYDPSTASYNTTGYGETQPTTGEFSES